MTEQKTLKPFFLDDAAILEIGVDEAGRGPMFGRVYTAAVILPKDPMHFNHALMKDSKKFHSEKKINEAAEYIKKNAIAWHVSYATEKVIDTVNIRNATHQSMHEAITNIILKHGTYNYHLLIDGNDFTPFIKPIPMKSKIEFIQIPHTCIEKGDNIYSSIAAASILAKVSRDNYIKELCIEIPILITNYDLLKNKGYGTQKHIDGIKTYGITEFHRKSFGICKTFI
jgi:ribonuclease HII